MRVRRLLPIVAAAALLAVPATATQAAQGPTRYLVTDLGTLPGGSYSLGLAINAPGQVVGVGDNASGAQDGFLWRAGQFTDISGGAGTTTWTSGVNDPGQVVGEIDSATTSAFLYSRGSLTILPNSFQGGGTYSSASDINNRGDVSGVADYDANGDVESVQWHRGVMEPLGFLPSAAPDPVCSGSSTPNSYAYAINDAGEVAGSADASDGTTHVFLYRHGAMTDLGGMDGANCNWGFNLNQRGDVVGESDFGCAGQDSNCTQYAAFLYENGAFTDLGGLGGQKAAALGVNNRDQVVGYATTGDGSSHAFIYENGVMTDLNSLIPADSGWVLDLAQDINPNGKIVGYGEIDGATHAFLLTPGGK